MAPQLGWRETSAPATTRQKHDRDGELCLSLSSPGRCVVVAMA
ncbi:MAG: hypothetical protein ACYDEH_09645 [Acidimicrobiales bacterium]